MSMAEQGEETHVDRVMSCVANDWRSRLGNSNLRGQRYIHDMVIVDNRHYFMELDRGPPPGFTVLWLPFLDRQSWRPIPTAIVTDTYSNNSRALFHYIMETAVDDQALISLEVTFL